MVSAAVTIRYWGFPEHKAWHICPLESEQTLAARGGPLPISLGTAAMGGRQCASALFLGRSRGREL